MRAVALVSVLAGAVALALGGADPFGRVALALGVPRVAAALLGDPGWRGVAWYRAGELDRAARDFAKAGMMLNLGNAELRRGNPAAALEAYDQGRAAGDAQAAANFDLLAAFYAGTALDPDTIMAFPARAEGPEMAAPIGRGDGRASGTGDGSTNSGPTPGIARLRSTGPIEVRRVFADSHVAADARWLRQLRDVPGDYLKARIAQEHKRRKAEAGR
ncbi:MAG: hypothetical protein CVT70_12720 [Alphaproteobacteria bacterium HGW-Alphaproteobacteria-1]|jgi:Ca-activated chloride channel family protein|nr:MAG: hypothetical protein CVT70_12720 [Alphaproteobacteria bacterium HGW-Alphaproteobacteria-1]